VVVVVWGSGSGIGRKAKARDGFALGRLNWWVFWCVGDVAGGAVGCEDELTRMGEETEGEVCRSTGDGRRQYKSNGGPRAWELWQVWAARAAAMRGRSRGRRGVASTQCTL